jgi:hypothetical protein
MREQPDETALFDSIMNVPDPDQEIDLRPAIGLMRGERVHHLVHKWCDAGLLEFDRVYYLVRLTKLGKQMREER